MRFILIVLGILALPPPGWAQVRVDGKAFSSDLVMPDATHSSGNLCGNAVWHGEIQKFGSKFIRLHFDAITDEGPGRPYEVKLFDRKFKAVFTFPKSTFGSSRSFWTGIIAGDFAAIEVCSDSAADTLGLRFEISAFIAETEFPAQLSIIGATNEIQDVLEYSNDPRISNAEASVAMIKYVDSNLSKSCSGVMVSDRLLLTNSHCIPSDEACKTAVALFGFQKGGYALDAAPQFPCRSVVHSNANLDFSLIELDGKPGDLATIGYIRHCGIVPIAGDSIFVLHHPNGDPKKITLRRCMLQDPSVRNNKGLSDVDFSHTCDTEGGSSGSPIFDESGDLVGLHHLETGFGEFAEVNRAVRIDSLVNSNSLAAIICGN